MTEITVETNEAGPPSGPEAEVVAAVAEAAPAVAETNAEAAVAIAQIEADTTVALAIIEGENSAAANERFAETLNADMERELAECRTRIADLETANADLTAEVARLTPPPPPSSSEPSPDESPANSEPTPDSQEVPEAAAPVEPPRKVKRLRWT